MTKDQVLASPSRRTMLGAAAAGAAALAAPVVLGGRANAAGKPLTLVNVSYEPTRELYKAIDAPSP